MSGFPRPILAIAWAMCTAAIPAYAQRPRLQRTLAETLDSWVTTTEGEVLGVADALPDDKYDFAPPTTLGDFAGVRTFAQQVKHLAADNYWMAALIMGQKPGVEMSTETGPASARSKAEILAYLRGSFAALHAAVATINSRNVVSPTAPVGAWQRTRLSFAVDAIAHSYDHYGQLVEYLRLNGIEPPASRPSAH
jgi:hypothetical protein